MRDSGVRHRPVPTAAWVLSGGTALALLALAVPALVAHGPSWFFNEGDAYLYRLTTRDLFGQGHAYATVGRQSEVPYRYGRIGLPFLAWVLALGRPGLVDGPLIGIHLAAIAAIPGLAAILLDEYDAPPAFAVVVLLVPGLLVIYNKVYADPLLIALILVAYLLESRGRRKTAIALLAFGVLVKELGALALMPWLWRAARDRNWRHLIALVAAVVPYAAWCGWVRWRVGQFPFLARTHARSGALGLPGVGIHDTLIAKTADYVPILAMTVVTIVIGLAGAWGARRFPLAGLSATFAVLTACLGPAALAFEGETWRVLALPQVFALLCLALALTGRTEGQAGHFPLRT